MATSVKDIWFIHWDFVIFSDATITFEVADVNIDDVVYHIRVILSDSINFSV